MKRFIFLLFLLCCAIALMAQTGPGWRYTPRQQSDSMVIYKYLKVGDGYIMIQNPVSVGQILRGVQVGNRIVFMNQPYVSEGGGQYTEVDPIYSASSWFTTTNNAQQWDLAYQAYLWGNHANMGYVTGTPWRNEGYMTSYNETDPTIYMWAKQAFKPNYTWDEILSKPSFATVANTGNYNDLTNRPAIPPGQEPSDWNATTGVTRILNKPPLFNGTWAALSGKPTFATVATSGDYNDLLNKPNFTGGQVNADWNATSGAAFIYNKPPLFDGTWNSLTGKPSFSTVATTGSYLDLLNRPTIPAAQVPSDWNATTGVTRILNKPPLFDGTWASLSGKPTFATVANTGSYNDLLDKPATLSVPPSGIPYSNGVTWGASIPNNSYNWNLAHTNMGKSLINGTSTYGNLSSDYFAYNSGIISPIVSSSPTAGSLLPITSGSMYTALSGKMSNWGLSLNGSTVATMTNGSLLDVTAGSGINITFFQGHLNFSATGVGTETDPTVYAWAKAAVKPTYTYTEVGAAPTNGSYSNFFRVERLRFGADNAWHIYGAGTTLQFNYNLSTVATLTSDGLITSSDYKQSDIRLKSHIRPLRSVEWVDNIHFYSYLFKPDGKYHLGVIAQEVQKEQPDLVTQGADGMLAVNMTEVLLAKIARLEQNQEKMQKEIKRLKRKCHER